MEVHHHPDLHHKKKNFKEYFLEFLMIFLAVTLGFFSENFRENLVNKEKEEHYMKNLISDLRADTADLNRSMHYQDLQYNMLRNGLEIPMERLTNINTQDTFFHDIFLFYSLIPTFSPSTNAISQLKAGGFNIMHNEDVRDSINYLYQRYEAVEFDTKYDETNYWDVAHKMQTIMHLPEPALSFDDPSLNIIPHNLKIFLTNDSIAIAQLYNVLGNARGSLKTCIETEKDALEKATKLIAYLQKKYSIE